MKSSKIIIGLWILMLLLASAICMAVPSPKAVLGTIYDLDGATQVPGGVHFSINNTDTGYYCEGTTKYATFSGKYGCIVEGSNGNTILIRAWNRYNEANMTVTLDGFMRDVNILVNMTYPNSPPEIISSPIESGYEDTSYEYHVIATDYDEDMLSYSLSEKPSGMTIDGSSGLISWTPTQNDVGTHDVTVVVDDSKESIEQSYVLTIIAVNDAPEITSGPVTADIV